MQLMSSGSQQHPRPLDVVIKTFTEHVQTFLQLQRDLLRHSRLGGKVYVIISPEDLAEYEPLVDSRFNLITTDKVLRPFGYTQPLKESWQTQQIMKLLAAGIVAEDQYLLIDANTVINFDFNEDHFFKDRRYLYAWGEYTDQKWEVNTKKFLGLVHESDCYGFRSVNQIFYKANVLKLIDHLEKMYDGNIVDVLHTPEEIWTEFKLYGYFCHNILADSRHFFQVSENVVSFNLGNQEAEGWIEWLRYARPLMVKVYKKRPRFLLTDSDYAALIERIKSAYEPPPD